MEKFRSKSYRDGGMQQRDVYLGNNTSRAAPTSMQDLRCYSANYASSCAMPPPPPKQIIKEVKIKKGKSTNNDGSTSKSWSFNDPELQRKKRVASYKAYAVEGKVKGSVRKSFRWIKNTYTHVVYGWW